MSNPEAILNEILKIVNADAIITDSFIRGILRQQEYISFNATYILAKVKEFLTAPSSSDTEDRKISVLKLIALGMYRGNGVTRMIKTSKPELRAWLAKMVMAFEIKDKVKGTNNRNDEVVTLSRMRMALPQFAFKLLLNPDFKRQISVSTIQDEIGKFKFLPLFCRDMCVMSLLPQKSYNELSSNDFNSIISHLFIYCFCESKLLKSEETKDDSDKVRAEKVTKYMSISWSATHVTTNMRKIHSLEMTEAIREWSKDEADSFKYQTLEIDMFAAEYGINLRSMFSWYLT